MTTKRALDEGETGQAKRRVVDETPVLYLIVADGRNAPYPIVVERQEDWFPELFDKAVTMLEEDNRRSRINVRDTMRHDSIQQLYTYLAVLSYGENDRLTDFDSDSEEDALELIPRDTRRKRIQDLLDAGKHDIDIPIPLFCGVQPYKTTGPCYHVMLYLGK